jgi:translation initiation factor IF-2
MTGMLAPTLEERIIGSAEVRQTFHVPKIGTIAGCYVIDGKVERNAHGRVLREGVVIYKGRINSLRRFKDDAKEVPSGYECGIGIENFNDIKVGDIIEAYVVDEVAGKL